MRKNEIKELIQKSLKVRHQIQVNRAKIDLNPIECIPLALSKNLLLVGYLYDFQLDGYKIVRIKDITSVKLDESEKFSQMILENEGILSRVESRQFSSFDSWEHVFKELKSAPKNIIVECESIKNGEFYIGKITEVNDDSLLLLNFNGVGEWDEQPTEIPFNDITSTSYDTRYILFLPELNVLKLLKLRDRLQIC